MSIDDRDIAFNTGLNYQKRHLTGTETRSFTGSHQSSNFTVTHNLGYIPAVRVFHEYNGVLFESSGTPPAADTAYTDYRINGTDMVVTVGNGPGSAKTVKAHYIIYLDSAT